MGLSEFFAQPVVVIIGALLAALLAGGGLGVLAAWLLARLFKRVPGLRLPFIPLPWSTLFMGMILFFILVMLNQQLFIRGSSQGQLAVIYLALSFLALVFFIITAGMLSHWSPSGAGVRLLGQARVATTLLGIVVTFIVEQAYPGFLIEALMDALNVSGTGSQWVTIGFLISLGLVFDLLLGIVQMLVAYRGLHKVGKEEAATKEVTAEAEEVVPVG